MSNWESKEIDTEFQIRDVKEEDMEQICDFHARCWKENFRWVIAQDYLDKFGKDPAKWRKFISEREPSKYSMFVYDKWWKVVGIIDGGPWDKEWFDFEIYGFYVNPDFQREWVGIKLWEYLMNSKNFKDKKSFYLRTLKDNISWWNFYQKIWWKIVDEMKKNFWDKEYDLVCYARKR
jgi:ribosomal protein S18 acetylase RimI-like enzyme